jgi:type II secretory pathway pseudopilin PulG
MRRPVLVAILAAALALAVAPAAQTSPSPAVDTARAERVARAVQRFTARAARGEGRVIVTRDPQTGETIAADFEHGCNPGSSTWNTKAAWGSGTVLEDRGCLREDDSGDERFYLYARTRRGGTAILSDWDFADPNTFAWIYSWTTDKQYGFKDNASNPPFGDIFGESFVVVANIPDCSQVAGNDLYQGFIHAYQVNPYGADAKSGEKNENSTQQSNSFLDCGHQS